MIRMSHYNVVCNAAAATTGVFGGAYCANKSSKCLHNQKRVT